MERKLNRELNYLLSTNYIPSDVLYFGKCFDVFREEKINSTREIVENKYYPGKFKQAHLNFIRIFELASLLGLSDEQLIDKWNRSTRERKQDKNQYKLKPAKEGRDNKGVYVGTGGDNWNKVRYPSKKRSKRVWKIFYQMFPRLAERDGWDGQTSKKMK